MPRSKKPKKYQSPLKAYQLKLKNKIVIGFGNGIIVLHDRSWWKLTKPIPNYKDVRLDICGRSISSVQIARGKLELVLSRPTADHDVKIYLDWLDENGNLAQPKLPVPGQPKAQFPVEDDSDWKEIDESLDLIEYLLRESDHDGGTRSE